METFLQGNERANPLRLADTRAAALRFIEKRKRFPSANALLTELGRGSIHTINSHLEQITQEMLVPPAPSLAVDIPEDALHAAVGLYQLLLRQAGAKYEVDRALLETELAESKRDQSLAEQRIAEQNNEIAAAKALISSQAQTIASQNASIEAKDVLNRNLKAEGEQLRENLATTQASRDAALRDRDESRREVANLTRDLQDQTARAARLGLEAAKLPGVEKQRDEAQSEVTRLSSESAEIAKDRDGLRADLRQVESERDAAARRAADLDEALKAERVARSTAATAHAEALQLQKAALAEAAREARAALEQSLKLARDEALAQLRSQYEGQLQDLRVELEKARVAAVPPPAASPEAGAPS